MAATGPWEALSGTEIKVLFMIVRYLRDRGRKGFTYAGLRAYWQQHRLWTVADWHTVERIIRRFASQSYGYLRRIRKGRKYIYIPTETFWTVYKQLRKSEE